MKKSLPTPSGFTVGVRKPTRTLEHPSASKAQEAFTRAVQPSQAQLRSLQGTDDSYTARNAPNGPFSGGK